MTDPLRLRVRHVTTYDYDAPVPWGLQQVRLRPPGNRWQRVLSWSLTFEGGRPEARFEDQHRNAVDLVSLDPGTTRLRITAEGEVEVADTAGIVGPQSGLGPLWLFQRPTPRTTAGPACARIIESVRGEPSPLHRLHDLSAAISDAVRYETGVSHVGWTAEDAVTAGHGVCQDQAHAFIACARAMGIPARYVSGYLLMEQEAQDAAHAWAEAWVPDLGWVGFDAANRISPDHRYVRVATGLDYAEAAPVSGARTGTGAERLTVAVEVRAQ